MMDRSRPEGALYTEPGVPCTGDTSDALGEIETFFRKSGEAIIALTVREILDEEIARKLA